MAKRPTHQELERRERKSPLRLLIITALSVFGCELLVMFIISFFPHSSAWIQALLDSTLLVVLLSPALYFFSFRPLVQHLAERKVVKGLLKESEERYRAVVESTSDAILMLDTDQNMVSFNQAFIDLQF